MKALVSVPNRIGSCGFIRIGEQFVFSPDCGGFGEPLSRAQGKRSTTELQPCIKLCYLPPTTYSL